MQTQIRLLLIRVYTVCNSGCIVWVHYSLVKPSYSNFRVVTANVLGVRIFRKFTVTQSSKILTYVSVVEPRRTLIKPFVCLVSNSLYANSSV